MIAFLAFRLAVCLVSLCVLSLASTFPQTACSHLTAALGSDKVQYSTSSAYASSLQSYYAQQEVLIQPDCIITPATPRDVAITVKLLSTLHTTIGTRFAVVSFRHPLLPASDRSDEQCAKEKRLPVTDRNSLILQGH